MDDNQHIWPLAMRGGRMGAWWRDLETNTVWWSRELEEIFGLEPNGFAGTEAGFYDFVHSEDRPLIAREVERAIAEHSDYAIEFRFHRADGRAGWMEGRGRATYSPDGRPLRLYGIGIDITERKRAEDESRRSAALLRAVSETTSDLIYVKDRAGRLLMANPATLRVIGQRAENLLGKNETEWQHDLARAAQLMEVDQRVMNSGQAETVEETFTGPEGTRVYLSNKSPLRDEQGNVIGLVGVSHDLTNRKRNEERIRESEARARLALQAAQLGTWRYDPHTNLIELDQRMREIWGEPADVSYLSPSQLMSRVHPDDRDRVTNASAAALDPASVGAYHIEYRIVWPDGTERWVSANGQMHVAGEGDARQIDAFIGTALDISEHKRAETALAEQARLLDLSRDAILVRDASDRIIYWSRGAQALYGYTRDEALGQTAFELLRTQFPQPLDDIKAVLWRDGYWEGKLVQFRKDGARLTVFTRWALDRAPENEGKPAAVLVINTDITEQERAEAALRESQAHLQLTTEAARTGTWQWHIETGELIWSPIHKQLWGYEPTPDPLTYDDWARLLDPEDLGRAEQAINACVQGQAEYDVEYRIVPRGQTAVRWIRSTGRAIFSDTGAAVSMQGVSFDITEHKRAEETLRQSEARLRQMADAMPQLVWVANTDGVVTYYNHRVNEFAGLVQADDGTWAWQPVLHPDDIEATTLAWSNAMQAEQPYSMEHRLRMAGGAYRWHLSRAYPGRDAQGRITQWFGTATDIHDLKQAEERLAEANNRFRIAERASNGFIYDLDLTASTETRSENFSRVLGYGESEVPGGREAWEALIHPEDVARIRAETDATLDPGSPGTRYEYRLRHKDGRWLWVLDENSVVRDAKGNPRRIIGTIVDINARKTNEERLLRLQAVTASLADAQTLAEVRQIILHEVVSALGSGAGGLRRVTDRGLVIDSYELGPHFKEDDIRQAGFVPLDAPHPAAEAVRTGEAVFASNAEEVIQRYPALAEVVARQGTEAIAHLALKRGDETFGVLSLPFAEPRAWDEGERAFALALADRAAMAYERARLFQASRTSEARFRDLADAMPQIVWANDASGQVAYFNRRWFDYTGLSLEDSLRDANVAVHQDDRPVVEAAWTGNLAHGAAFEYEIRLRREDGDHRWHLARCVPARDGDGCIIGWYGTSTDIHERKQAEMDTRFLADLGPLLNRVSDPSELIEAATRAVAEHFAISRCALHQVDLDQNVVIVEQDFHDGLPSLSGVHALTSFSPEDVADFAAGRVVVRCDTQTDPRTADHYATGYAPRGIRAVVVAPLMRFGRLVAALWISSHEPRNWTHAEIELLGTAAERIWLALENARLQAETQALNSTLEARVSARTAELRESREQLRRLSAHAERTREDERRRIAREVHDELGGALTVLKMSLVRTRKGLAAGASGGGDDKWLAALADMIGQVDTTVQTVRRIASDLRPSMLDDLGLVAALDWQAHDFEKRTGIVCQVDLPEQDWPLDGDAQTAIFRVFQESLTNVARHAQATRVVAAARQEGDWIVLEVRDDGRGIGAATTQGGKSFGLLGMRERMRDISGEFDIANAAGGGTLVTIRVPLRNAATGLDGLS